MNGIRKKEYNEGASPQEVELIRKRVQCNPATKLVSYNELPIISEFSVSVMSNELEQISNNVNEPMFFLGNLEGSAPPSTRATTRLKEVIQDLDTRKRIAHMAIFGLSPLLKIIASFVFKRAISNATVSIHKDEKEALEAIEKKRAKLLASS